MFKFLLTMIEINTTKLENHVQILDIVYNNDRNKHN